MTASVPRNGLAGPPAPRLGEPKNRPDGETTRQVLTATEGRFTR
ncbi:hypothetical protein OG453_10725 [Streptomyces sp. NBC_01381]|nr:hypothetical protein [Streptomyces sp. NBC_01381]MCX4667130.1 hypothetical protein [Streptomyces sp. NBC_01381]